MNLVKLVNDEIGKVGDTLIETLRRKMPPLNHEVRDAFEQWECAFRLAIKHAGTPGAREGADDAAEYLTEILKRNGLITRATQTV